MPRIRTIKPEFWNDEKISSLSPIDRLVFLGLIGMADDFGRVHHNVKVIDAFIFPNSDDTCRDSLATLSRHSRVTLGTSSSGMPILEIVNWDKHQKVDKPQRRGALPPIARSREKLADQNDDTRERPVKNPEKSEVSEQFATLSRDSRDTLATVSRDTRETLPTVPRTKDLGPRTKDLGPGSEGGAIAPAPSRGAPPTLEEVSEYVQEAGLSQVDPAAFVDHYQANGWKQSNGQAIKDWQAACRGWNRRQSQFGSRTQPRAGPLKGEALVAENRETIKRYAERVKNGTVGDLFGGAGYAGGGPGPADQRAAVGSVSGRIVGPVG